MHVLPSASGPNQENLPYRIQLDQSERGIVLQVYKPSKSHMTHKVPIHLRHQGPETFERSEQFQALFYQHWQFIQLPKYQKAMHNQVAGELT
jgi:hypothetical protein